MEQASESGMIRCLEESGHLHAARRRYSDALPAAAVTFFRSVFRPQSWLYARRTSWPVQFAQIASGWSNTISRKAGWREALAEWPQEKRARQSRSQRSADLSAVRQAAFLSACLRRPAGRLWRRRAIRADKNVGAPAPRQKISRRARIPDAGQKAQRRNTGRLLLASFAFLRGYHQVPVWRHAVSARARRGGIAERADGVAEDSDLLDEVTPPRLPEDSTEDAMMG